jgi:NAD(P)-dependent dehydrogenase (short-subunit alcohol dehydrogenase family)
MTPQPPPPAVALVTGAADRIGAAIARRLAAAGTKVVIHYRTSGAAAEKLAAEILTAGGNAAVVQADLSRRSDRRGLISAAAASFGPLTVLVNNASLFEPDSIDDLDEELWDRHFAVHVEAPAFLARDFARQLPDGAEGNIVNIIDERVLQLSPAYFSYTLSKAALWDATRTMAQSLAPRIRVNAIGPGPTLRHDGQSAEAFAQAIANLPLQRGATPEEIGEAVAFILATPSLTGQMLALDGGRHLAYGIRGKTARKPQST